ncbi:type II toxin-antitoxin system PemK/MazF family toxin [Candidatus Woesearchaeota archaeon]|nr:type II toxin-antitoxin system PemK/MazF family toxin [Candidatus Woesearchaeota archaeon]
MVNIKRGDILMVNLEPVKGSEQGSVRPVLVIQNDIGNNYSPTTIIAPITSKGIEEEFPTDVKVLPKDSKLEKESKILLNQIRTIDKSRIIKKISALESYIMKRIDSAIKVSLGLE